MTTELDPPPRVLGAGALTGVIAGLAAGAIDALWSWGPAAQFVPGALARSRFVLLGAFTHAAAGLALGLALTAGLLVLSRASRLGDLVRFGYGEHRARQARDVREAVTGLALALATLPCVGAALVLAYRLATRYLAGRKAPDLVVIVAMGAGLAAVAVAVPLAFVLGRGIEVGLRRLAPRVPIIAHPLAPLVAGGMLVGLGIAAWLVRSWETARLLPLRGPAIALVGLALAAPAWALARRLTARLGRQRPAVRRAAWIALAPALLALVLASGSTPAVVKATTAFSGLGGPLLRGLRAAFDRDRDGYARFLGGGDCDDGAASVHPGAPEIPDDGIDQNCVGGDASTKRTLDDVGFAPVPAGVPPGFNVLVITIDTIRADHLGAYGYARATSPSLDRLAAEGTLFENGWAHAPSTRYSIPAILTGRLPLDVHYDTAVEGWPGLSPAATTFAEALAPLGFDARGAITNYWYFDRQRRMDQGFTSYDNENAARHASVSGAGPEQTKGSSSQQQTDKALAFVQQHAASRWLLWVHYYDPHYAYEPHPETPSFGTDRTAMYDGEIRFTDHHLGRLLDDLRARGLYDRTVIVVTGDHGEGFGEHGIDLHGYHLYAPQTKVPMIVRVPGVAPRRSQTPAGHADLLPTLVNLAGGTADPEMMGRSLVGAIAGVDAERPVFQQLSYEGNHEMRAAADRTCHVIYNVSPDTSWEVYRIDRDPAETTDLAGDPAACASTRRALERWFDTEQVPAGAAEALLPAKPVITTPLDADLGPAVRLLAVDAPRTAKRGDVVTLTWTFEARGTLDAGWKVFVHAEGPGRAFWNGDHRPARPFEWWQRGQFIRYTTTVIIPRTAPAGTFTVWAGLFKGARRAPATAPHALIRDNGVAVATLQVLP